MAPDDRRASGEDRRRERLSASLRANLKRRKAQKRGRAAEPRPDGVEAGGAAAGGKTATPAGERDD